MSKFSYIIQDDTCTVIIDNVPHIFRMGDCDWHEVVDLLNDGDADCDGDELLALIKPQTQIENAVNSLNETQGICTRVELVGGKILFDGMELHNALTERMYQVIRQGLDITRWLAFAENIYSNPLDSARTELFLWLEGCGMPMTDDGCFLAFKKVSSEYKDLYSNTFDNSVGSVVEMDRSKVDTNRYNTCSVGLHFCSSSYLPHFGNGYGSKVVIVKINPADVVAIPNDYSNAKGRTWRYEVVGEMPTEEAAQAARFAAVVETDDIQWSDEEPDGFDVFEEETEVFVNETISETLESIKDKKQAGFWQSIFNRINGS